MVTLTFAGDESGDVSFAFDKGASLRFVVAVIGTSDPEALRQRLVDLRQNSSLPPSYEFSFNRLSSAPLRRRAFKTLAEADFEAWAVIVDKTILPDTFRVMNRLEFYLYFVTELIQLIPVEKRADATLILDEYASAKTLRTELRRFMVARGIPRHFRRILVKRSQSEPLIQVADLVAGAVLRREKQSDGEAYRAVETKLRQVLEFRP